MDTALCNRHCCYQKDKVGCHLNSLLDVSWKNNSIKVISCDKLVISPGGTWIPSQCQLGLAPPPTLHRINCAANKKMNITVFCFPNAESFAAPKSRGTRKLCEQINQVARTTPVTVVTVLNKSKCNPFHY